MLIPVEAVFSIHVKTCVFFFRCCNYGNMRVCVRVLWSRCSLIGADLLSDSPSVSRPRSAIVSFEWLLSFYVGIWVTAGKFWPHRWPLLAMYFGILHLVLCCCTVLWFRLFYLCMYELNICIIDNSHVKGGGCFCSSLIISHYNFKPTGSW